MIAHRLAALGLLAAVGGGGLLAPSGDAAAQSLKRGAKSPDFAGAPYGAGLTLALKHLYPCR